MCRGQAVNIDYFNIIKVLKKSTPQCPNDFYYNNNKYHNNDNMNNNKNNVHFICSSGSVDFLSFTYFSTDIPRLLVHLVSFVRLQYLISRQGCHACLRSLHFLLCLAFVIIYGVTRVTLFVLF